MAVQYKPPKPLPEKGKTPIVFLAGSIDMGQAEDWQQQVVDALAAKDVLLLNPRRDDWDSSWQQRLENPPFRAQVEWELDGLALADVVLMYLGPQSKAPISLLELGLCAAHKQMIVCCAAEFWRRGNVEVVCHRYQIPLVAQLCDAIPLLNSAIARSSQ